jgi:plastocyanin
MRGLAFAPASLTIAVGDSVRVRNADTGHHTFTDAPLFDSGDMAPGATYTYRFRTAGRFDFVCSYHSGAGMTGTVTVR